MDPDFLASQEESMSNVQMVTDTTDIPKLVFPKRLEMANTNKKYDIQRMLFKIYLTLFLSNPEQNFDSCFQLFLVHLGWIKIMANDITFIGSNHVVLAIYVEFFNLTPPSFLSMISGISFHNINSSGYYKAFSTIYYRIHCVDWNALQNNGCSNDIIPNQNIIAEFEHMNKLVRVFNKLIENR
jgi:hypothetical protein